MRCRIAFETDAENEYFSRDGKPGSVAVNIRHGNVEKTLDDYVGPSLSNGLASLTFDLPNDVKVNDRIVVTIEVTDDSRIEPFRNVCDISVLPAAEKTTNPSKTPKSPTNNEGDDRSIESGIALPNITPVLEDKWGEYTPPFDKFTALRIVNDGGDETKGEASVYDFFVNEDNFYLKSDLKEARDKEKLVKSQFTYGMVLTGLALLHQHEKKDATDEDDEGNPQDDDSECIEARVEDVTKALAPFIIPMIEALGAIEIGDDYVEETGDETD